MTTNQPNQQPQQLTLLVTPAAWNYLRRAIGLCPHDESHPLIVALEQQIAQQLEQQQAVPDGPTTVEPVPRPNGAAHPQEGASA